MAAEKAKVLLNDGNSCLVPFTNLDNFKKINASVIADILYPDDEGKYKDALQIDSEKSVFSKAIEGFRTENEALEEENEKLKTKNDKLLEDIEKLKSEVEKLKEKNEKLKAKTGK